MTRTTYLLLLIELLSVSPLHAQSFENNDILISFHDTIKDEYGYKNLKGDVLVPSGKYNFCYTDTFKTYALVAIPYKGDVAIDRQENVLYNVFSYDNGPDYVSEGLFRIILNDKIGYADSTTGKIVIEPQYGCAHPFENGVAKVSLECKAYDEGGYSTWLSNSWFYIDRTGKKVNR